MKFIARLISFLFHPIFLTSYAAAIIIYANPSTFRYLDVPPDIILIRIVINTLILPALALLMLRGLGLISSFSMYERQGRTLPYITSMFFYFWSTVSFFMDKGMPDSLRILLLGVSIGLSVCFFTNILILKVSLHVTAAMSFLVYLAGMYPQSEKDLIFFLILAMLGAGLVGSSRLILKAHTPKEIAAGYLVGLFSMWAAFLIV